MNPVPSRAAQTAAAPEPTWEVALLFPTQGAWSEEDYLALDSNRLVELSHGRLEVLSMPTTSHQLLVAFLYRLLLAFVASRDLGIVLFAPLRVRLWRGKFREPDVVFLLKEHADRIGEEYWKGADLAMEVVSAADADRGRDLEVKRREYARAGIAEYWIVDPREQRITVLRRTGKQYALHGEFAAGTTASSHLLRGFAVNVAETFSQRVPGAVAAKGKPRGRRRSGAS